MMHKMTNTNIPHTICFVSREELSIATKRPEKEKLLKSLRITIQSQLANDSFAQIKDGWWILFSSLELLFSLFKFVL